MLSNHFSILQCKYLDMKNNLIIISLLITFFACSKTQKPGSEEKMQSQDSGEWINLLDNTHVDGWRAYNGDELPPGWIVKDGVLSYDTELGLEQDYRGGIDIIYGEEEFENFELSLEWKLPEGGNSGVFYHLKEGFDGPAGVCPEYQLIDDVNYARIHDLTEYNTSLGYENPSQLHPLQKTASDYAMYAADDSKNSSIRQGNGIPRKSSSHLRKWSIGSMEKCWYHLCRGLTTGTKGKIPVSGKIILIMGSLNLDILACRTIQAPFGLETLKSKNYKHHLK